MVAALTVKDSDRWRTPAWIVDLVRRVSRTGQIDLDPCGHAGSLVGARRQFLLEQGEDGFALRWSGFCYVNPPYSRGHLEAWLRRCRDQADAGAEVVALVPGDSSTDWWHGRVRTADAFCQLKGRVQFVGAPQSAKFGSVLVYFGTRPDAFVAETRHAGWSFSIRRKVAA